MAPSRRQINGRSPLVNQQRQITSFFGKSSASSSLSPSPSPPLSNKKTPKSNPNPTSSSSPSPPLSNKKASKFTPNLSSVPPARSPSPGPETSSPVQYKLKKPVLVIGQTPSPPKSAEIRYGNEVVGKQVRVYWPLDKKWYDGSVTSYNKCDGKHVVQYDDGEEESLDLGKEKIEWVVEEKSGLRFKRLKRGASGFRKVVKDDDDDVEMGNAEEEKSDCDDSSDEDWGKNVGKEVCESDEDDVELDDENELDDEEMVEEKDEETPKTNKVSKTDSRKRKTSEVIKSGGDKKSRTDKDTILKGLKASVVEPVKQNGEGNRKSLLV